MGCCQAHDKFLFEPPAEEANSLKPIHDNKRNNLPPDSPNSSPPLDLALMKPFLRVSLA